MAGATRGAVYSSGLGRGVANRPDRSESIHLAYHGMEIICRLREGRDDLRTVVGRSLEDFINTDGAAMSTPIKKTIIQFEKNI